MKKRLFLIMIFFNSNEDIFCQKNDYNTFNYYSDFKLNKLLNGFNSDGNSEEFYFYDTIKSFNLEEKNEFGQITNTPTKYYYDMSFNLIKKISKIDSTQHILEYFRHHKKEDDILKYGILVNSIKDTFISYNIDSINNLLILNHYKNNKIIAVDSIFYIENFKPIETRHSELGNQFKSTYKYEYHKNGLLFKEVYKNSSNQGGFCYFYDDKNYKKISYSIKFDEFDSITPQFNDSTRKIVQQFTRINNKDFIYIEGDKKVIYIDSIKAKYTYRMKTIDTTIFNNDFNPIKSNYHDYSMDYNAKTTYKYNKFGDIIEIKHTSDLPDKSITSYIYTYDNKSNWIIVKRYENGKLFRTIKREIEYY